MVSGIITELSAASELITCSTATKGGAEGTLYILFISEADVDVGKGETEETKTSLLSTLQVGKLNTRAMDKSKTKAETESYVTAEGLDAARDSPLSKKLHSRWQSVLAAS